MERPIRKGCKFDRETRNDKFAESMGRCMLSGCLEPHNGIIDHKIAIGYGRRYLGLTPQELKDARNAWLLCDKHAKAKDEIDGLIPRILSEVVGRGSERFRKTVRIRTKRK